MDSDNRDIMRWRGAAHYQLSYRGLTVLIDPLFTRLPGDRPHLEETKQSVRAVDYLLLTHGHLDHSWDVPYLVSRHQPEVWGPAACLRDVSRRYARFERAKWHALEAAQGHTFPIADIDVTPYQVGTEEIDWWFMRDMAARPLRHRSPRSIRDGLRWLSHHIFSNCFAFHFRFQSLDKTMLFFGNLTDDVAKLRAVERVDVLALPYCPANASWLEQTKFLIERFEPGVVLVHHFDNFMNPFTCSKYMDLGAYSADVRRACPDANLFPSKFCRDVDFAEILAGPAA